MAKKKFKSKGKSAAKASKAAVPNDLADVINSELIATAYSPVNQSVFMKLCRLCESKDGPFLNIFDADKVTAKKIEELMPFGIGENDDLPHKICFRCSAKVEELHEFIQKCIRTQENLRKAIGKTEPLVTKIKTRTLWEERLNKSNISNDDICDALIKKAMEGIKVNPAKPLPVEDEKINHIAPFKRSTRNNIESPKEVKNDQVNQTAPITNNAIEVSEKLDTQKPQTSRQTRSNKGETNLNANGADNNIKPDSKQKCDLINRLSFDVDDNFDAVQSTKKQSKPSVVEKEKVIPEKPFNIMDHVSMIKVTGVGILFQCKLCNRNFVKKEVVESHNCAKNGMPKVDNTKNMAIPEPPKVSTVKYIKMDTTTKHKNVEKNTKINSHSSSVEENKKDDANKPITEVKPKPRIGPASKVKKVKEVEPESSQGTINSEQSKSGGPSVVFPTLPSLNGRYKLVPGPNNTFTLIEENASSNEEVTSEPKLPRKRKASDETARVDDLKSKQASKTKVKDDVPSDSHKPYPVGLFQTVPHHSRLYDPPAPEPPAFTTPAMKKQSYTVVQTGNPSKLLISTKPQPPAEEVPKKRQRKTKPQPTRETPPKEPFTVTLEDVAPPKDSGFFTFINVDPLLQPSYVLPTDNIIQESQISTSSTSVNKSNDSKDKDKYSCNLCGEHFSREKKLVAHIQSHYTKMDEEDQMRAERVTKKKGKKQ